jgi:hypothetical protein
MPFKMTLTDGIGRSSSVLNSTEEKAVLTDPTHTEHSVAIKYMFVNGENEA